MEKGLFIYNSRSGDRTIPGKLSYILDRFQNEGIIIQPYTLFLNDGLIDKIVKSEKYNFILASGGDGTISFVANYIIKNNLNIPFGIFPMGTCNDFGNTLNIPANIDKCIDLVLNKKSIDVDTVYIDENDKYFLSNCAGGLFSDISFNTQGEFKKNFGQLAYYISALNEINKIEPFNIIIEYENNIYKDEVLLFVVMNGKNVGGLTNVMKNANITDGYVDILLLKKCTLIEMLGVFFKIFNHEDVLGDEKVTSFKVDKCKITADRDIIISTDGERDIKLPINLSVNNKKLKIYVP